MESLYIASFIFMYTTGLYGYARFCEYLLIKFVTRFPKYKRGIDKVATLIGSLYLLAAYPVYHGLFGV